MNAPTYHETENTINIRIRSVFISLQLVLHRLFSIYVYVQQQFNQYLLINTIEHDENINNILQHISNIDIKNEMFINIILKCKLFYQYINKYQIEMRIFIEYFQTNILQLIKQTINPNNKLKQIYHYYEELPELLKLSTELSYEILIIIHQNKYLINNLCEENKEIIEILNNRLILTIEYQINILSVIVHANYLSIINEMRADFYNYIAHIN